MNTINESLEIQMEEVIAAAFKAETVSVDLSGAGIDITINGTVKKSYADRMSLLRQILNKSFKHEVLKKNLTVQFY